MDKIVNLAKTLKDNLNQQLAKDILEKLVSGGRTAIAKRVGCGIVGIYALYAIAKNQGWLKKKIVKGQHILVTGGGSGIGRQMAIKFAKLGANVSIVDLNYENAVLVEKEIGASGFQNNVKAYKLDVSNSQQVKEVFQQATLQFGPVDILINNAGIVSGKKLLENSDFMIEKTIAVNCTSHHYTVREVLPQMLLKNHGHIVTIASIAGHTGVCGLVDYCASKFGAVGFDESLRMEMRKLGKNIKTTCICPYFINTGMFDGVKTRFPLLLPILTEEYATKRIVNAILQEEPMVIMPWFLNTALAIRQFVPTCVSDALSDFFGSSDSMADFKGRGPIAH